MDTGKGLGLKGEDEIKWADVVSGGDGMIIVVRISGERDFMIQTAFMIFQKRCRAYLIEGVPDDVPSVLYSTDTKGWMDATVIPEWLREPQAISKLPNWRK